MQTIKDLVNFLSQLDGDYPIPFVDKIVGANECKDLSLPLVKMVKQPIIQAFFTQVEEF